MGLVFRNVLVQNVHTNLILVFRQQYQRGFMAAGNACSLVGRRAAILPRLSGLFIPSAVIIDVLLDVESYSFLDLLVPSPGLFALLPLKAWYNSS
jgi:hypothetical protein